MKHHQLEQACQDLNVIFCELTSFLVLTSQTQLSIRMTRGGNSRQVHRSHSQSTNFKDNLSIQTERVSEYVIQLLRGEAVATSQLGHSLTPASYIALLPTIWSLLNNPTWIHRDLSNSVLQAILDHAFKVASKSALKKPTIEFVARVVLVSMSPIRLVVRDARNVWYSLRRNRNTKETSDLDELPLRIRRSRNGLIICRKHCGSLARTICK
jgi:pre-rRNA-processing protein IPI1